MTTITHKSLGITKRQFKNIAKLTLFVKNKVVPPRFDINVFFKNEFGVERDLRQMKKEDYICGTSACFLGYGPLAGFKADDNEFWTSYSKRVFGEDNRIYEILFDTEHKNSKTAAVKRAAWLLTKGFPIGRLINWEAPRSFKPDWTAIEKIANS